MWAYIKDNKIEQIYQRPKSIMLNNVRYPSNMFTKYTDAEKEAIGIYPGGQSGNPGSSNYDNLIDQWKDGEYLNLNFTYYKDKDSLKGKRITFINED